MELQTLCDLCHLRVDENCEIKKGNDCDFRRLLEVQHKIDDIIFKKNKDDINW